MRSGAESGCLWRTGRPRECLRSARTWEHGTHRFLWLEKTANGYSRCPELSRIPHLVILASSFFKIIVLKKCKQINETLSPTLDCVHGMQPINLRTIITSDNEKVCAFRRSVRCCLFLFVCYCLCLWWQLKMLLHSFEWNFQDPVRWVLPV